MVARWRAMGDATHRFGGALRASLAEGLVACSAPVARIVDLLESVLETPDAEWPLLQPVEAIAALPDWSPADRDRISGALRSAVAADIRPAFAELRAILADEILPAARPRSARGSGTSPAATRRIAASCAPTPRSTSSRPRSTTSACARSSGSTASSPTSPGASSGPGPSPRRIARLRDDAALSSRPATRSTTLAASSLARANEAIPDVVRPPPADPRARSCAMQPHEEAHSTIAYYRQPAADGSRPGQYYINTCEPDDAAALRGRGPRLPRVRPRAPPPDRDRPGARRGCRRSGATSGRPPSSRAGACTPSASPTRWASTRATSTGSAMLSFDAWRASPARRRHRHARHGLDRASAPIDFMLEHTALGRRTTSRTRSTATSPGRARRSPTSSASSSCSASGRRRGRGSAPPSTSAPSTTPCWAAGRSPCRRSGVSSKPGRRQPSPRVERRRGDHGHPDGGGDARDRPAQPRHPVDGARVDAGHRRGLGGAGGRAPGRLRRRRRRARRGRVAGPDGPRDAHQPVPGHRALRPRRARARAGSTSCGPSRRAPSRSRSSWTCPSWCSWRSRWGRVPPPSCGRP